jgi:hypothetical protein
MGGHTQPPSLLAQVPIGVVGVVLFVVAWLVIHPTLEKGSGPPAAWALAVGDQQERTDGRSRLSLRAQTQEGCKNPVRFTGTLREERLENGEGLRSVVMAADGAALSDVHFYANLPVSDPSEASDRQLREARMNVVDDVSVIPTWRPRAAKDGTLTAVSFSFAADVARSDGFGACWVSVPQLLPHGPGWPDEIYEPHDQSPFEQLRSASDEYDFEDLEAADLSLLTDGWLPDTGSMTSAAVIAPSLGIGAADDDDSVRGPVVRTTCAPSPSRGDAPSQSARANEGTLTLCQATYRFTEPGASSRATRLTFAAGLIFSVALALIVEAMLAVARSWFD